MSIIKIKNSSDNTWMDMFGIPGKSAYKIALENGYTGTEIEFGEALKNISETDLTHYDVAYTHSQSSHAPANAQKNSDITKEEIETKLAGTITTHNHSGTYEPVISTKNTAFNVNFETTATNIKINGTQSLGSLSTVARADHIHPADTTKVPTTRTINSKPLSSDITLTLDDISNGTTRSLDNYSPTTHNHDTNYSPLSHASDATIHVTESEKTTWNAKSNFDGNYNNLNNKPVLYLTGTEASPIVLWKLESGFYIIDGYVKTNNNNVFLTDHKLVFSICNYSLNTTTSMIQVLLLNDLSAIYNTYIYNKTEDTVEKKEDTIWGSSHIQELLNTKVDKIEGKSLSTNDLTSILKTNYDVAYTHSQASHAPVNAQANSDITKTEIETKLTGVISTHTHTDNIVATDIVGTTLTLTTDKYQRVPMVTGTTIVLPTVTSFTEIHLFFDTTSDLTLSFPSCKWQVQPTIAANKSYELIFTYNGLNWLGGCISYE